MEAIDSSTAAMSDTPLMICGICDKPFTRGKFLFCLIGPHSRQVHILS
jgi:hypothetical protein